MTTSRYMAIFQMSLGQARLRAYELKAIKRTHRGLTMSKSVVVKLTTVALLLVFFRKRRRFSGASVTAKKD